MEIVSKGMKKLVWEDATTEHLMENVDQLFLPSGSGCVAGAGVSGKILWLLCSVFLAAKKGDHQAREGCEEAL